MKRLSFKSLSLAVATAGGLFLAACSTATPYQPLTSVGMNRASGGFSDYQIASDRFRITFQGNSLTERDTVERYLLFRAAELTVQNGFDYFQMVDRDTERQVDRSQYPVTDTYYAWRPTWYQLADGRWGVVQTLEPEFYTRYETTTSTRYQAQAEIFLRRGDAPRDDARVFNAKEVIANLGPTIVYPESRG